MTVSYTHLLDELPQFWNVLKGDMSLIGPRPERPLFVEKFKEEIPRYMIKHQVRPGITGWAQVNGFRGDTSIRSRIEHDLYYIENWMCIRDSLNIFNFDHNHRHILLTKKWNPAYSQGSILLYLSLVLFSTGFTVQNYNTGC